MLLRLHVSGFKNLVDTEVWFGPFTCIAGRNGVGKSNVFDALSLLANLAELPLNEAASQVRGGQRLADLFTYGRDPIMSFECDLLIPKTGVDKFSQPTTATHTTVRYELTLKLVSEPGTTGLRVHHELLRPLTPQQVEHAIGFPCSAEWRKSVETGSKSTHPYIEGDIAAQNVDRSKVYLPYLVLLGDHELDEKGTYDAPIFEKATLTRTVLSGADNRHQSRTAVLVKREMRSWRAFHLEPSALRTPSRLHDASALETDGRNLPAVLFRIAASPEADRLFPEISNRLATIVDDTRDLEVLRDDVGGYFYLRLTYRSGHSLAAPSLSDGTLRFIALCALEADPSLTGIVCLEEPENGIHPERLHSMIDLLQDMAMDATLPVDASNPLRQVIVSTHSPGFASMCRSEDLVFGAIRDTPGLPPGTSRSIRIRPIQGSWRHDCTGVAIGFGAVRTYLNFGPPPKDVVDEPTLKTVLQQRLANQVDS